MSFQNAVLPTDMSGVWALKPDSFNEYNQAYNLWLALNCDTIKGNKSHVSNNQCWFFNINHLFIQNTTFWFKPHLNRTTNLRRYEHFLRFRNNVKHKKLSHFEACNSKSIFPTSDSFPLDHVTIMLFVDIQIPLPHFSMMHCC